MECQESNLKTKLTKQGSAVKKSYVSKRTHEFWGLVSFAERETYPLSLKRTYRWVRFET